MKQRLLFFFLFASFTYVIINAQDLNFDASIRELIESGGKSDTINQGTNQTIQNIQTGNNARTYISTNRLSGKTEPLKMSDEALFLLRRAVDSLNEFGPDVTYQDTVIMNPLYMPPLFNPANLLPGKEIVLLQPTAYFNEINWQKTLYKPLKTFQKETLRLQFEHMASRSLQRNTPSLFHHSILNLPSETTNYIEKTDKVELPVERRHVNPSEYDPPLKFIPDRKYWISSFESAVKFSENSTSDNWHTGATKATILNLFTRNIVKYNYAKDRIKLDNTLEVKLNFFNSPNDTLRQYKVSDDLLRLHSNFGVKAFNKWYYSLDAEFRTQLFTNYLENTMKKQASVLSPYNINFGLGMKYDHTKQYERIDRSLVLSVNLAPIAYNYMSTISDSIDWGRYGFPKDDETGGYKNYLSKLGSTIDFNMTLKPNRDVTWKSRFRYFTSYDRVIAEFENSLDFAISRFFSTLLYLHLRYDDGVTKANDTSSFLQWNQLISFGFNYKW